MSEQETPVPAIALVTEGVEQDGSLLDSLAQKHSALANTKSIKMVLPGYDQKPPFLLAQYGLVDGKELALLGEKVYRETKDAYQRQLYGAVDTMIMALQGFYVDLGDGLPKELTYQREHLTRFDVSLAQALKFEDKLKPGHGAREVVFSLFGGNDIMIVSHSVQLSRWLSNTSIEVDEAMFGGNR